MPSHHSQTPKNNWKKRNQSQYLGIKTLNTPAKKRRKFPKLGVLALAIVLSGSALWFRFGTIQGVPVSIVGRFLMDRSAREAYFSKDRKGLHDRLNEMGIEEDIKAYYRPRFDDEAELDWYIHQLLYERTGYVGQSYKLGANQRLILKTSADKRFPHWFRLAQKVGIVQDHYQQDGIIYLILSDGTSVLYEPFAQAYTIKFLRQINRRQKRQNPQNLSVPRAWKIWGAQG